jgi:hypothetical protein
MKLLIVQFSQKLLQSMRKLFFYPEDGGSGVYQTTRCHIQEECNLHSRRFANLAFHAGKYLNLRRPISRGAPSKLGIDVGPCGPWQCGPGDKHFECGYD